VTCDKEQQQRFYLLLVTCHLSLVTCHLKWITGCVDLEPALVLGGEIDADLV